MQTKVIAALKAVSKVTQHLNCSFIQRASVARSDGRPQPVAELAAAATLGRFTSSHSFSDWGTRAEEVKNGSGGLTARGPVMPRTTWPAAGAGIARTRAMTQAATRAISVCALIGWAVAADADPLPPVPDISFIVVASVQDDGGGKNVGGPGQFLAEADGSFGGAEQNHAFAKVFGRGQPGANGFGKIGALAAEDILKVTGFTANDAFASAGLDWFFRVTQTAPFPSSLLGLPVPLLFTASVEQTNNAFGDVRFGQPGFEVPILRTTPGSSGPTTVALDFDTGPNEVFHVGEDAQARPLCSGRPLTHCLFSIVVVDPVITFDQQRFDDLATQHGVPSVALDQFFTLDVSPGLDLLPRFPSDNGHIFGPPVAEPSTLTLLLAGIAGIGLIARCRRTPSRGTMPPPQASVGNWLIRFLRFAVSRRPRQAADACQWRGARIIAPPKWAE